MLIRRCFQGLADGSEGLGKGGPQPNHPLVQIQGNLVAPVPQRTVLALEPAVLITVVLAGSRSSHR